MDDTTKYMLLTDERPHEPQIIDEPVDDVALFTRIMRQIYRENFPAWRFRFSWSGPHTRHLHRGWYRFFCRCGHLVDEIELPLAGTSPRLITKKCPACRDMMTWRLKIRRHEESTVSKA